jgi:hypothetical protein
MTHSVLPNIQAILLPKKSDAPASGTQGKSSQPKSTAEAD